MKKVCVIGADGQLGAELILALQGSTQIKVTPLTIDDLDLLKHDNVRTYFHANRFDIVVNCAAYTAVDLAEKEMAFNDALNNQAVRVLAASCEKQGATFIQISTDFVFDGTQADLLKEEDQTNPIQAYGRAKLEGEQWVKKGLVIRTSWLYSPFGNNFLKTMLKLGDARDSLNVVVNQIGTPTYAYDLAQALVKICSSDELESKYGIYHFSNEGVASWYDFTQSIMEYAGIACNIRAISDGAYPTAAARPKYSVLDKTKIKEAFEIEIPYWRDSVKACIKRIQENEGRN